MSEELVDQAIELREKCSNEPACRSLKEKLEECTQKVNSHPGTNENCEEELFDFLRCVDQCVAPKLFSKLK
ncbi:cytochrome b-c1 complex subunit mitochondrial [Brachionus plicatilis]|uniref:Cytochrome b-c1 complex subunit 6 n=1 Tax=Brachionus plicatilis TaxID=10195 RepID=A0A3M7RPC6_BRAPC|nr:cytochrome b-c1 complex subunit mitochondrial [Brachionus plicatilis]